MISASEQQIIDIVRDLKPFESLEIHADKNGKANRFICHRSYKIHI